MFVQSVKFIQEHAGNRSNISVFGQEANADTWKMAKMNMAIRGIDANFGKHHEDTFLNDLHATQKFDYIMANPPFNLSNWGQDKLQNDPPLGIRTATSRKCQLCMDRAHDLSPCTKWKNRTCSCKRSA